MKLTVNQLRRIIKEEVSRVISEAAVTKPTEGVHPNAFLDHNILNLLYRANNSGIKDSTDPKMDQAKEYMDVAIKNINNLMEYLADKVIQKKPGNVENK